VARSTFLQAAVIAAERAEDGFTRQEIFALLQVGLSACDVARHSDVAVVALLLAVHSADLIVRQAERCTPLFLGNCCIFGAKRMPGTRQADAGRASILNLPARLLLLLRHLSVVSHFRFKFH
jgi:hypothetical protein